MAETFYRIKGERGYLHKGGLGEDSWRPTAGDAVVYGIHKFALMRRDEIRSAYDPAARVVKTTLKQAKCAGEWVIRPSRWPERLNDWGRLVVNASKRPDGGFEWRFWGKDGFSVCVSDRFDAMAAAQAAADAYLRKHGWVLA